MPDFELSIDGAARTPSRGLGISINSITRRNMQPDEVSMTWHRQGMAACPMAHDSLVELWTRGRRVFVGRARIGAVSTRGAPVRLVGPWSYLDERVYHLSALPGRQMTTQVLPVGGTYSYTMPAGTSVWTGNQWYVLPAPLTVTFTGATRAGWAYPQTTGAMDVNMVHTSRGWLYRPIFSGGLLYTTLRAQLSSLVNGAYYAANESLPWQTAAALLSPLDARLGRDIVPRAKTVVDISLGEAWRQTCAHKPGIAFWWDYSTETPTLDGVDANVVMPVALTTDQVLEHGIALNDDTMPSGVVVRWEETANPASGMGRPKWADFFPGQTVLRTVSWASGATTISYAANGALEVGMMLAGTGIAPGTTVAEVLSATSCRLSLATTGGTGSPDAVVVARRADGASSLQAGALVHTVTDDVPIIHGLAEDIYTSLQAIRAQGQVIVPDPDYSAGWHPGHVIELPDDPMLAGARCLVQQAAWNASTGQTTLTIGPPQHLGLRERADLYGWLQVSISGPFWTRSWIVAAP